MLLFFTLFLLLMFYIHFSPSKAAGAGAGAGAGARAGAGACSSLEDMVVGRVHVVTTQEGDAETRSV